MSTPGQTWGEVFNTSVRPTVKVNKEEESVGWRPCNWLSYNVSLWSQIKRRGREGEGVPHASDENDNLESLLTGRYPGGAASLPLYAKETHRGLVRVEDIIQIYISQTALHQESRCNQY